jgi:hypothetical protein
MKKFALLAVVAAVAATMIGCGPAAGTTKPSTAAASPTTGK